MGFTGCGKTPCLLAVTVFWRDLLYEISMRGDDQEQTAMFSYLTLAQRIPADHPARQIRVLVDRALARMDAEFNKLYSATGRPSIAPERLLRATLLMVLYSIRSERQLMEQMNYNLLFRWFVGLEMDDAVWDVTVFTKNRERLLASAISQRIRKQIERVYGWSKLDRALRQVKLRGLARVDCFYRLTTRPMT
jgi:transposase